MQGGEEGMQGGEEGMQGREGGMEREGGGTDGEGGSAGPPQRVFVVVRRVVLVTYPLGVGDGRSPPFALPGCVLAFAIGRGWWVLVLALVRVAWLHAPVRRWGWVLAPARVASLGARVRCLRGMVVGARARPRPRSCHLAARSRWWWVLGPVRIASLGARVRHWWGMVAGARPRLCLVVCSPRFVWSVAWHRCCMSSWLSVGGVLLVVYGTRGLTID